jgi:nitroreductase
MRSAMSCATNVFEPNHTISDEQIEHLVHLATRAPTSFNLQNWRFLAVRTPERKAKLRKLAYDQAKVSEAAVTFIVCGQLADYSALEGRLAPSADAGFMSPELVAGWVGAAKGLYDDKPQMQRDEAIRRATFGAGSLLYAAEVHLGNERLQVNDHRSMYFEHLDDPGFTFDRALFAQPFLISSYHENLLNLRLRLHRRLSRS